MILDHPEAKVTRLEYEHRPSEWRLGQPKSTTIEGMYIGIDGRYVPGRVLSRSIVTYHPQGRVASTAVLQDGGSECTANAAQWSITSFPAAAYNQAGLPTRIVENARTVEVRYDPANLYVSQRWIDVPASASSRGAHLEETLGYDPRHGTLRWQRDINGDELSTAFDASGRVLTRNGPDGMLERNTYTDVSSGPWTVLAERYTDPGKVAKSMTFLDGYGRALLTNEEAPVAGSAPSAFVRAQYQRIDGYGRVTTSYQPRGVAALTTRLLDPTDKATLRGFDGFDRTISETLPDGRTIKHAYTYRAGPAVYLAVQTTNPRSFVTQRIYDFRGALVRVERQGLVGTTAIETFDYKRDGLGRLTEVGDATGVRNVAYDVGGRLVAATLAHRASAPARTHEYCFDPDGQLTSALTPEGREVFVQRDTLGRPQRVQVDFLHVDNGTEVVEPTVGTFMYDCAAAENSLGKLCERSDDSGTTHYTYDAYGRQNSYEFELADPIASTLPAGTFNWYRGVGVAGQLKSASYDGLGTGLHRVDYTHDVAGRTSSIKVDDPLTTPRVLVKSAGYNEFGHVVLATLGNNVVSSWVFDKPSQHLIASKLQQLTNTFAEAALPARQLRRQRQHRCRRSLVQPAQDQRKAPQLRRARSPEHEHRHDGWLRALERYVWLHGWQRDPSRAGNQSHLVLLPGSLQYSGCDSAAYEWRP